jgi:putative transposase
VSVSRTVFSYRPRTDDLNQRLCTLLKELASKHRRWGHPKLHRLVRRDYGLMVNHKRTERLYRQEGLSLRIRRKKKLASVPRTPAPKATGPNERWAMDFIQDSFWNGRRFRCLTIVDTFTKECPVIEVDTSLTGQRVVRVLEYLRQVSGLPKSIRIDNGPEFISQVLDEWAHRRGVNLDFIRPGKPTDNSYIESFHDKFRDECLNQNYFLDLKEAKEVIEAWRREYNTVRPHESLDQLTPMEFMAEYKRQNNNLNPQEFSLPVV